MSHQQIVNLRAKALLLWQQVCQVTARVPVKARIVLGLFLVAALFMAINTALTAKDSTLHVKIQHGFRNAQVSVWVDSNLAYDGTVSGSAKKKFGFIPTDSVQGTLSQMIPVRAGRHTVRVRIAPDDGTAQEDSISGEFAHKMERDLSVSARYSGLALAWQGSGETEPETRSGLAWLSGYAASLLLTVAGSIISALTGFAIKELPNRLRSAAESTTKADPGAQ